MDFLRRILTLILLGGLTHSSLAQPTAPAKRPNILVIFSDDQGLHDVGCFGAEFPTPNMDELAKQGAKLTNFYVAAPVCTPSRFGLLTGQFPNRSQDQLLGALMFLSPKDANRGIRPQETTIASVLRDAGYTTALIGKWHLGHGDPAFLPHLHGFDYAYGSSGGCNDYFTTHYGIIPNWYRNGLHIQEDGYVTDLLTHEAVHYLKRQTAEKPFFLYLTYTAPHFGKGWDSVNNTTTNILQAKVEQLKEVPEIKDPSRREYAAMVTALDEGIGHVLTALRESGLEDNTLVIFTSDNGADPHYGGSNEPFRGTKNTVYEGGVRVPCIMRWQGHIPAGSVVSQPLSTLDFFPTFCSLAGVSTEGRKLDGFNFLPAVTEGKTFKRTLFWQTLTGSAYRDGDWKYLHIGKQNMLFDLAKDPYEKNDLSKKMPKKLLELQAAHAAVATGFTPRVNPSVRD